jgi:hypothetical protein
MRINHRTMDWLVHAIILISERAVGRMRDSGSGGHHDTIKQALNLQPARQTLQNPEQDRSAQISFGGNSKRGLAVGRRANRTQFQRNGPTVMKRALVSSLHRLTDFMFDCYRPERHYMRGPGPKWHAARCQAEARETAGRS